MGTLVIRKAYDYRVGRYPGWWSNLHRLPKRVFRALSDRDESGALRLVHLPLRGQRRLGWLINQRLPPASR